MTESERRLAALGRRRARAKKAIREISAELPDALRAALDEGTEKKRAAELAQISRPALDEMLRRQAHP